MQQNRRRTRRLALSVLVLGVCTACEGQGLSPVEPSDTGTFDARLSQDVGLQWSPYVGVHLDGRALEAYRDALSALQRSGHLRGVRIRDSQERSQHERSRREGDWRTRCRAARSHQ